MKLCQYVWDYVSLTKQLYNLYNRYQVNQDLETDEIHSMIDDITTKIPIVVLFGLNLLNGLHLS